MKNNHLTVNDCTPSEIIASLADVIDQATIFDRSNDPKFAATERENLKNLGVRGNWKVIRKKPEQSS